MGVSDRIEQSVPRIPQSVGTLNFPATPRTLHAKLIPRRTSRRAIDPHHCLPVLVVKTLTLT